jgi:RNA polymerase sigma-70 factor (ECF subfamily)
MDQMAEWDDESLDDFENPEFRSHSAAVLKDWSAQDFANIYTRFRPHLERHARRFLRSQHQVDEVVQDAFLYLMVTLPELDSEIGVLRFLKWKVRLLCLDVIRASGRAIINNIDEIAEPASNDAEVGSEMEHIEDAAIVRLALSKLNPRHREVLLASMYEEKSTREIASQVGLSENATLQLIFRARAAFKKALLGDGVDTAGMSVSAILSVAARKAAHEAKKISAQAMVFVLFAILAVGAFVTIGSRNQQAVIAEGDRNPVASSSTPSGSASASSAATNGNTNAFSGSGPASQPASLPSASASTPSTSPSALPSNLPSDEPSPSSSPFTAAQVRQIFSTNPKSAGAIRTASVGTATASVDNYDVYDNLGNHAVVTISTSGGIAHLDAAMFDFTINGYKYFAFLQETEVSIQSTNGVQTLQLNGVVKLPFDEHNVVWDRSPLAGTRVALQFTFGAGSPKVSDAVLAITAPAK